MTEKGESKVTRQGSTKNLRLTVRFANIEELEKVEAKAKECGFATAKQTGVSSYLKSPRERAQAEVGFRPLGDAGGLRPTRSSRPNRGTVQNRDPGRVGG